MNRGNALPSWVPGPYVAAVLLLAGSTLAWAQQQPAPSTEASQADAMTAAVRDLQEQVKELRSAVAELKSEGAQYRAETTELRHELETTRSQLAAVAPTPAAGPAEVAPSVEDRVTSLEESSALLSGKVDEQYQTKIESASKYRMRLSGIVLLNLFRNSGEVNSQDMPEWATNPTPFGASDTFGATLRQSEIGLEVFGPQLAGAKTRAEVQFDFAGGFPSTLNGVNLGLVRLRTASMRMDWGKTAVVAGQDSMFLSPLSPTSFASLATPTFGYSGNLWGWTPQVRVEHRFDLANDQSITLQGGILDNLSGEPPYLQSERIPQGGERSAQPAYGVRASWTRNIFGQPVTIGTAGYYGRQDWGFERYSDSWAGMMDWQVPLARRVEFSGEFYRGRGLGGLGGGVGRSVLFNGGQFNPNTLLQALDAIGGWSQIKVKATPKLEFNGAFGLDNPYANDLRAFASASQSYLPATLAQNRGALANFIYRPRSNLLFSGEYRHLETFMIDRGPQSADQVNLIMGILF